MKITKKGFTLIELLVVITIIVILAGVTYTVLNPFEIIKRGRDSTRIANLTSLNKAIATAAQEASGLAQTTLCFADWDGTQCTGQSNVGTIEAVKKSNGTGWIKVDLGLQNVVSMPTLPVDPVNTAQNHFTYCSDGSNWELAAALESVKEANLAAEDGGDDPVLYEVGSDLTLISPSGGNCVY